MIFVGSTPCDVDVDDSTQKVHCVTASLATDLDGQSDLFTLELKSSHRRQKSPMRVISCRYM